MQTLIRAHCACPFSQVMADFGPPPAGKAKRRGTGCLVAGTKFVTNQLVFVRWWINWVSAYRCMTSIRGPEPTLFWLFCVFHDRLIELLFAYLINSLLSVLICCVLSGELFEMELSEKINDEAELCKLWNRKCYILKQKIDPLVHGWTMLMRENP